MKPTPSLARIEIIPIKCKKRFGRFDLGRVTLSELGRNNLRIRDRDILVVSSKFVSMAEGRFSKLKDIRPGNRALKLATKYGLDPHLAQLVINESEDILGGIPGFALALTRSSLAPNAGIDRSNIPSGYAIMYPKNPERSAEKLRSTLLLSARRNQDMIRHLAVILCDSRITPTRLGTVGVAVSVSGLNPVEDLRGEKDLFGNELKFTTRAIADQLSSAAELAMGEADDSVPLVLIRGISLQNLFTDSRTDYARMAIEPGKCLIVQGLKNPFSE
jgi:coenzyme F420-0:L-glutamate ligase